MGMRRRWGQWSAACVARAPRFGLRAASVAGSAILLALCEVSGGHPWLASLALLPLFRAIQVSHPAVATFYGGVWGATLYAAAGSAVDPSAASSLLLIVVAAVYTGLGAWVTRRVGYRPLVLAVGWMFLEIALTPVGLKSGLLATTQGDGWLLHLVGRLFGSVWIAFLVAFASASLLAIFSRVPTRWAWTPPAIDDPDFCLRLWQVITSGCSRVVACSARPRGPPPLVRSGDRWRG